MSAPTTLMPGSRRARASRRLTSPSTEFHGSDGERAEQGQAEGGDGLGLADRLPEGARAELNAEESTAAKGQQYEEAQVGDGKPGPASRAAIRRMRRGMVAGPFAASAGSLSSHIYIYIYEL